MNKAPAWVGWTYVAYVTFSMAVWAGIPAYAVFWRGHNPWYLCIGIMCSFLYSPWRWFAIWDGVERPYEAGKKEAAK